MTDLGQYAFYAEKLSFCKACPICCHSPTQRAGTHGSKHEIQNVIQTVISITSRKYSNHPLPAWVCCEILTRAFVHPWDRLIKQMCDTWKPDN